MESSQNLLDDIIGKLVYPLCHCVIFAFCLISAILPVCISSRLCAHTNKAVLVSMFSVRQQNKHERVSERLHVIHQSLPNLFQAAALHC